jgi:DNA-binding GntR family transcriptional regulator
MPRTAPPRAAAKAARTVRRRAPQPAASAPATVIPLRPPSLTDQAYVQLEELIVTLQIAPGSPVSEAMLSERLGIGRTPVREALQRLAREHLVVALPQRGYLVSYIDVRLQLRLLETRREVERLIVRSAARRATLEEQQRFGELAEVFEQAARDNDATAFIRADREFNELSLQAARNEFAGGAMQLMHGLARRFWYMHWRQAADLPETARAHGAVARAISLRDDEAAAQALDALLDGILAFTKATLSTSF